jgi:hypothetical protein
VSKTQRTISGSTAQPRGEKPLDRKSPIQVCCEPDFRGRIPSTSVGDFTMLAISTSSETQPILKISARLRTSAKRASGADELLDRHEDRVSDRCRCAPEVAGSPGLFVRLAALVPAAQMRMSDHHRCRHVRVRIGERRLYRIAMRLLHLHGRRLRPQPLWPVVMRCGGSAASSDRESVRSCHSAPRAASRRRGRPPCRGSGRAGRDPRPG